jgi:anti-anti-sigma factor
MFNDRPVIVLQLPDDLVMGSAHLFFKEIRNFLTAERPRIVFDFSTVKHMDSAGVQVLLNSMEEVMKRNGDLKLAAISKGPASILDLTRVSSLFEIFDRASEAVESFDQFPVSTIQPWAEISSQTSGRPA